MHLSLQAGPRGSLSGRWPYPGTEELSAVLEVGGPHHGHRWNPACSAAPCVIPVDTQSNLQPVRSQTFLTVGSCSSIAFTFPTLDYLGSTDPSLPLEAIYLLPIYQSQGKVLVSQPLQDAGHSTSPFVSPPLSIF